MTSHQLWSSWRHNIVIYYLAIGSAPNTFLQNIQQKPAAVATPSAASSTQVASSPTRRVSSSSSSGGFRKRPQLHLGSDFWCRRYRSPLVSPAAHGSPPGRILRGVTTHSFSYSIGPRSPWSTVRRRTTTSTAGLSSSSVSLCTAVLLMAGDRRV